MPQRLPPSPRQFPGFGGQLLAAILGLVVVVSFITLGFVVFLVLLVVGSVFWMIFLVRSWWFSRGKPPVAEREARSSAGDTLEGEFKVVNKAASDSAAGSQQDGKG